VLFIIEPAFVCIAQYLISLQNEAHAFIRVLALVYVRMIFEREFHEGGFDGSVLGRMCAGGEAVLLAGIVAMQVEVLKLGASMGRAIERGTALQNTNELLRENVATLADDVAPVLPERIRGLARWLQRSPVADVTLSLDPKTKLCLYAQRNRWATSAKAASSSRSPRLPRRLRRVQGKAAQGPRSSR